MWNTNLVLGIHQEKIAILVFLVVLVSGIFLEIILDDCWDAFQRSGSLLVCLGIYLAARDLRGIVNEEHKNVITLINKYRDAINDIAEERIEQGKEGGTAEEGIEEAWHYAETTKKRIFLIEITILIIGTFIWGFGDLIAKYFIPDLTF